MQGRVQIGSNTVIPVLHPPLISLPTQTAIADVSATVGATLDCNGLSTVWSIEYGATSGYGSTQAGGTTSVNGAKTIGLTALTELTTIHWRFKAVNADGTAYGADQTLTTIETAYINRLTSLFNNNIIAYYPTNETSGTAMVDAVNGRNAIYSDVVLNQAGVSGTRKGFKYNIPNGFTNLGVLASHLNMTEGTVSFWIKPNSASVWNDTAMKRHLRIVGTTAGNYISITSNTTTKGLDIYASFGNVLSPTMTFEKLATANWSNITITWSTTGNFVKAYFNGVPINGVNSTVTKSNWTGVLDSAKIALGEMGSVNTTCFPGYYSDVFFLNRAVLESELTTLFKLPQIIFCGDSRTRAKPWALSSIGNNLISPRNIGWTGESTSAIATRALTYADPEYRTGLNNIVCVWGGVNDGAGQTAQNIYDRLKSFCEARKAVGFKTIVCTEIDCQSATQLAYGWHSTIYPELNTLLRADHSFADGFADLGANSILQDATNTTYFLSDKIHLTVAGYDIVSSIVAPVISSLM